jgi:dihydroorotase
VRDARERGILFDVGHGVGSFAFRIARRAVAEGFLPDTISTDIHNPPPDRTVYLMNDLVSQFHALGVPLEEAVAASTSRPAKVLGLEESLGSLAPGMAGDAAVFDLREGRFVWHDSAGNKVDGKVRLDTYLTVRNGEVAWREGRLTNMGNC